MRSRSAIPVLAVFFLLLLAPFPAYAQGTTYSISGAVKSMTTGQGVPYAAVDVRDAAANAYVISAYCDATGKYSVTVPAAGEYTLSAMEAGFEQKSSPARVQVSESSPAVTGVNVLMASVITFSEGWNFISFPREPVDSLIETALAPILANIEVIWTFGSNKWSFWQPGNLQKDLFEIRSGKGYWFHMTTPTYLDLSSWYYPNGWLWLSPGWNLVGFAGSDGHGFADALNDYEGQWSIIWTWDKNQWYAKDAVLPGVLSYPPVDAFKTGQAYWVKLKESADYADWDQAPVTFWQFTYLGKGIRGATVTISTMDGTIIYRLQNATMDDGFFFAPAEGLPSSFIVELTGGTVDGATFTGYFKRVVANFTPHTATFEANEITTLVAEYMRRNPTKTYDEAAAEVKTYLSIPATADFDHIRTWSDYPSSYFTGEQFRAAQGAASYADFVSTLVAEIGTGTTRNFSPAAGVDYLMAMGNEAPLMAMGNEAPRLAAASPLGTLFNGLGQFLGFAMGVFGTIGGAMGMADTSAADSLMYIADGITQANERLGRIEGQLNDLNGRLGALGAQHAWMLTSGALGDAELFVNAVADKYKEYVNALADSKTSLEILRTKVVNFFDEFRVKDRGTSSFDNFYVLLQTYQDLVMRGKNRTGRTAIKECADSFSDRQLKTGESEHIKYQIIELQFERILLTQARIYAIIKDFKALQSKCVTYDGGNVFAAKTGADVPAYCSAIDMVKFCTGDGSTLCKASDDDLQRAANIGFSSTVGTMADPVIVHQTQSFVEAVEDWVLSHVDEAWWFRWSSCDQSFTWAGMENGISSPVKCTSAEMPFTRSMFIANTIIGKLKTLTLPARTGDAPFCSAKDQNNSPKYGHYHDGDTLFMKLMKDVYDTGAPRLEQQEVKLRDLVGGNEFGPFTAAGLRTFGTRSIATYSHAYSATKWAAWLDDRDIWRGLHPFTEAGFYDTGISSLPADLERRRYFPNSDSYKRLPLYARQWSFDYLDPASIARGPDRVITSFASFNARIVPHRTGYLSHTKNGNVFIGGPWRHPSFPIVLRSNTAMDDNMPLMVDYNRHDPDRGTLLTRVYRLRPGNNDAIGFYLHPRRRFILPAWEHDGGGYGPLKAGSIISTVGWWGWPEVAWTWQEGDYGDARREENLQDYVKFTMSTRTGEYKMLGFFGVHGDGMASLKFGRDITSGEQYGTGGVTADRLRKNSDEFRMRYKRASWE